MLKQILFVIALFLTPTVTLSATVLQYPQIDLDAENTSLSPMIVPYCENFSGSWDGECRNKKVSFHSDVSISQPNCDRITLDSIEYSIPGHYMTSRRDGAPPFRNVAGSTHWSHSQESLYLIESYALSFPDVSSTWSVHGISETRISKDEEGTLTITRRTLFKQYEKSDHEEFKTIHADSDCHYRKKN